MIRIAFYKAIVSNWRDHLISMWTGGPFSHCELVLEGDWLAPRKCFSASMRDGGVLRFKNINVNDTKRWTIVDVPWMPHNPLEAFCKAHEGAKYDWLALFCTQWTPLDLHSKGKWFCSEICFKAINDGYWDIPAHKVHPNMLFDLLFERNFPVAST